MRSALEGRVTSAAALPVVVLRKTFLRPAQKAEHAIVRRKERSKPEPVAAVFMIDATGMRH